MKICLCEKFSVMFKPIFGHLYSVKLTSLFAMFLFSAFFMSLLTWFHNLAVSMQKLSLEFLYFPCSFHSLVVESLTTLSPVFLSGSFWFKVIGKSGTLIIFQASISFISAASWFTEGRLYLSNRLLVVIWSLIELPGQYSKYIDRVSWKQLISPTLNYTKLQYTMCVRINNDT